MCEACDAAREREHDLPRALHDELAYQSARLGNVAPCAHCRELEKEIEELEQDLRDAEAELERVTDGYYANDRDPDERRADR